MVGLVPDPLPLRNIEVPREVTAVDGCTCGGMTFHRAETAYDPPGSGCALWSLPPEQATAAVEAAEDRLSELTAALNRRLRESGFLRRYGHRVTDHAKAQEPEATGLDPALLPYLDWPLWLREGGLTCYKDDCPCEHDGDIHQPEPPHWLLSERVTARAVLESLKQHAAGKP